jgi:glyoxylase-like metal-dependent hydrolase (beta-lactamase superfamily II)
MDTTQARASSEHPGDAPRVVASSQPWYALGDLTLHLLTDGSYRSDAGTFFGLVPKELWQRRVHVGDDNLMRLALHCLLIVTPDGPVLVDTGMGTKLRESEKLRAIWRPSPRALLVESLARAGYTPEDVRTVVFTHLHADHAGGATYRAPDGELLPTFPNARHIVQRAEWVAGLDPPVIGQGSYYKDNYEPLERHGLLDLADGDVQIAPGVRTKVTAGHTPGHQMIEITGGGEKALYLGDLVCTTNHLKPAWNTAFDIEPLTVIAEKQRYLTSALEGGWLLIWDHDSQVGMGRLRKDGGVETVVPGLAAEDLS